MTVSATLSICSCQVPCSSTTSGLRSRTIDNTLSLMARQFGLPGDVGIQGRDAGTGSELRDAEIFRLLRLAQAGHQRRRGRISPHKDQRPPVSIGAILGKRHLLAEIEQALMKAPARTLRRHTGHGADFRRKTEIEAAPPNDGSAGQRDQHHRRAQAERSCAGLACRNGSASRQTVGGPCERHGRQQDQFALDQCQRREFDRSRRIPIAANARERAGS